MAQGLHTLMPGLPIILGLPVLFAFAGWLFVKFWRDPTIGRPHVCPHCQRPGQLYGAGRFQCAGCQQEFCVDENGRDVASVWQVLIRDLVWTCLFALLLLGCQIGHGGTWPYYWLMLGLAVGRDMLRILPRRQFPWP